MAHAAPHRGSETEVVVHGRCALAVTYAAEAADARVGLVDGLAVALTGRIDNAAELGTAVGQQAVRVAGPDIDVLALLAAGFRACGPGLPAKLRGAFAVAITDGEELFCFRDHIGFRSLFHRSDDRGFYVASEAKQVVAGAELSMEPDLEVLEQIYYASVTDDTPAALTGVRRLPKSSSLHVDATAVRQARYWDPAALLETARIGDDELRERFESLMSTAVARCLTGDDAISLSGGIDSPAIAAFAAPQHLALSGRPLLALSVVFPRHPSVDESRYVRLLADHYEIPLHTYEQTANPLADLAHWTGLADGPYPGGSLAEYEEDFRKARALGRPTVLTGEHAEFLIAFQWNVLDHYLSHGRWAAARRELALRRARGWSYWRLVRLAVRSVTPDRILAATDGMRGLRPPRVPGWLDASMATQEESVPVRERWLRTQLGAFIGPGVSLEAEEVCQAVCRVQSRKPWTDVDLWEFFLSLPAEQKFPDLRSKGLVRNLLRGHVPDTILDRTDKTVFDAAALTKIDYPLLRRYLDGAEYRMPGVDYRQLGLLLERESLTALDYMWARSLATVHAFLSNW
jgi:asparagine synthase (glutamine-hydrolysing)